MDVIDVSLTYLSHEDGSKFATIYRRPNSNIITISDGDNMIHIPRNMAKTFITAMRRAAMRHDDSRGVISI
jgi:outer membrane lipoprotein-sorting protein